MATKTVIELVNPFGGARVQRDITGLTQEQLDAYALLMDDEVREQIHLALAPCTPESFLAEWARRVGPEIAGSVLLGS